MYSSVISRFCARFFFYILVVFLDRVTKEDYNNAWLENPYLVFVLNIGDILVLHRLRALVIFSQPLLAIMVLLLR